MPARSRIVLLLYWPDPIFELNDNPFTLISKSLQVQAFTVLLKTIQGHRSLFRLKCAGSTLLSLRYVLQTAWPG